MDRPKEAGADDRRSFLKKAGTFAAITPPAVTFLLSTSMSSKAIAASGGTSTGSGSNAGPGPGKPGNGFNLPQNGPGTDFHPRVPVGNAPRRGDQH